MSEVWHIYVLIFLLQTASASFTPVFQALIPDVLPDEDDYTQALSLSRLAYDLENLLSPAFAALLLSVISFHGLFAGTVLGFLFSAALVARTPFPARQRTSKQRPFKERLTRGSRIYLATPRLRGLLSLNMSAAAIGAFALVNSVVLVRAQYGFEEGALALAMAAFGGGSMLAAIALPRLLAHHREREIMVPAAICLTVLSFGFATLLRGDNLPSWSVFLSIWALFGLCYASILTPSGRLLRISAHTEDRPAIFAAQFALSHACWLITYPLAGWLGQIGGLSITLLVLSGLASAGIIVSLWVWPKGQERVIEHTHPDLPKDHPHLMKNHKKSHGHAHAFVIDDEHRSWPTHG